MKKINILHIKKEKKRFKNNKQLHIVSDNNRKKFIHQY